METTIQPSSQNFRTKITTIEAIELALTGFALWVLFMINSINMPEQSLEGVIGLFVVIEVFLLGLWAIYNAYIRIARDCSSRVDVRLRILAAAATGTYTLWAWIILDINRFLMSKIFYQGEAPVEYAWSVRSKQRRGEWEKARTADSA
jgi:hypothetical protein